MNWIIFHLEFQIWIDINTGKGVGCQSLVVTGNVFGIDTNLQLGCPVRARVSILIIWLLKEENAKFLPSLVICAILIIWFHFPRGILLYCASIFFFEWIPLGTSNGEISQGRCEGWPSTRARYVLTTAGNEASGFLQFHAPISVSLECPWVSYSANPRPLPKRPSTKLQTFAPGAFQRADSRPQQQNGPLKEKALALISTYEIITLW